MGAFEIGARARLELGWACARMADFAAAEPALRRAYDDALAAGSDATAIDAAAVLVYVLGQAGHERETDALAWARHARALLDRTGNDPLREARLAGNLGMLHHGAGRFDDAATQQETALELREGVLGPEHPDVASAIGNLAASRVRQGQLTEAEALYARALAISEHALGADHPTVGAALDNLGVVRRGQGNPTAAIELHRRSLAIREAAFGPDTSTSRRRCTTSPPR